MTKRNGFGRYASFKKPIWVTEYDLVMDDLELAGHYTRDFYTAMFSRPEIDGVVMWGFWDGSRWKHNAPLFTEDWQEKPAGKAYRELVLGEWRTNVTGTTDAKGVFRTRGFLGDYELTAALSGKEQRGATALVRSGARATLELD
jgi:endo-1,4-beta-xylanase